MGDTPPGQPKFPGIRVEGSYLHLLAGLQCSDSPDGSSRPDILEAGGRNNFVAGGFPTDWTNAKVMLRLRGELDARGGLGASGQHRPHGELGAAILLTHHA